MADKRIQDLTPASSVQTSDRFVLEQSGQAKSLTGQILINDLAAFLDGHGGINDISYTAPSGSSLTGTLTVTLADETVETFTVTNGRGITGITKTGTSVLEDTYQITYNDGSTPTEFTVTNGRSIESVGYVESIGLDDYYEISYNDESEPTTFIVHNGEKGDTGDNWYVHIKWAAEMPTQDSDMVNYPSDFIGIYAGIGETAPTSYGAYEWYEYKGEKGDTGTGITSVILESSSGLVDTYRVSFDDGTSTTFNVTNGSEIDNIAKTYTSGLTDTYTVTLTNGLQTTFQVNNGKSIVSVTWTNTTSPTGVPHVPGATDTYTIAYNDGDATTFQIYNGLDGEGASLTVDGIPSVNGDVPLLTIDTEHGAPTPQTAGSLKSRYFDALNSVLYICLGYDQNSGYIWRGAGVTVDAAMSTTSTNPVQNRVITNKIGTAALDTTAQDLSGAVNEILDDISGFADNLAEDYDATATYSVGDLCLYDNTLYRCNTAIATPEAWNSIHWTATSLADEKVSKSGDTMTDNLIIAKSGQPGVRLQAMDYEIGSSPSSAMYPTAIWFRDKNNENIGQIIDSVTTAGSNRVEINARNLVSGSGVTNILRLGVTADGNRTVEVSDASVWRTTLNAVNKTGDTMTGDLNISGTTTPFLNFLLNSVDQDGAAPSGAVDRGVIYKDKDGQTIMMVRCRVDTSNLIRAELHAQRSIGGTYYHNALHLGVDSSGNRVTDLSDAASWRKALGLGSSTGALPITVAQGGTGQTGTSAAETTVSNIAVAGSGFTISSASYRTWGKVAQLYITVRNTNAISANAWTEFATLVSGKKPAIELGASLEAPAVAANTRIQTGGSIGIRPTTSIAANTTIAITATYLLP